MNENAPKSKNGRYRQIQVQMWGDEKFCALSPLPPSGQALWLYLLTGPQTGIIPGLFRAGRAGMAEELEWSVEQFDERFAELLEKGMAKADFKTRIVWLPNAIKHNPPANPNIVKSWRKEFDLLPECPLKFEAYEALKAFVFKLGEGFAKAFDEAIKKPTGNDSANGFGNCSPNRMPNQQQQQGTVITDPIGSVAGSENADPHLPTNPATSSPPAPTPQMPSDGDDQSPEDQFWRLADKAAEKGIVRSRMGQLVQASDGDYRAALISLTAALKSGGPSAYVGKIISNSRDRTRSQESKTSPPKGVPPFVADAMRDGMRVEQQPNGRWRIGADIFDRDGQLVGF